MIPEINGRKETGTKTFRLQNPITVCSAFSGLATAVFEERMKTRGYELQTAEKGYLVIGRNSGLQKEEYTLSVTEEEIRVEAAEEQGVIWALTTLWKKLDEQEMVAEETIQDHPRYAHRGLHLDTARHFFSAEEVKRILEQLSLAKINVLHWHLADDQGWRIESRKYPKLQEQSGDYYTQEEIRDVVSYAAARGIEIVPEIDMPGHTRSILAAYPEYSCSGKSVHLAKHGGIYRRILCAGAEKTYAFLEELLDEICPLFPSERFHIGGDEAPKAEWKTCPACQAKMKEKHLTRYEDLQGYFSVRVSEILKKHGKKVILWDDSLESTILPEKMQMQYWSVSYNKASAEYINNGGSWIYSDMFELYLDYPHAMTSVKKIFENQIDLGSCAISPDNPPYGYEACVWTEHIETNEALEQHIFPRIYVLAELAWHGAGDYTEFEQRLEEEMGAVQKAGISVVPKENWNPEGENRQREAFSYMMNLNIAETEEEKGEMVDPSDTGEEFKGKFMTRFFRAEDMQILAGGK